ncbi:DsbE family thiol:disulfide interchange protein [Niveibacterium umoris]|uniref:Cytochrome c biogenesis protein CcmG/thiol:disulfide interchange protein DsbE n=1 Tax=Niveibacterium umoris TaxID=1193620 RepID=A0A840BD22_9RHOO|nr:DsbE family thiol:disulfide interchange protein [Niveibacterium umoris]MBB4010930.1 cytochrome c biogenesis protein CcmG/thiol:disulfide interchange protein DsbE [Niveibacterium umoris]
MKRIVWIPIVLFVVLLGFLAVGLNKDPHSIPSPLIDKPAPAFRVPQLGDASKTFSPEDMRGKVWMLNVWASWCVSCRDEHPVLVAFSRTNTVPLVGLDYKDQPADAKRWLGQFGNPYSLVAVDADGRVGIDYGVYGVPETYVIDRNGVIRFKQIGPVTQEVLDQTILPLIKKLST